MTSQQSRADRQGALIVGASSGIGAALARQLVADGYRVALVARRQEELNALARELNAAHNAAPDNPLALAYVADVTDYDAAPALFARIFEELLPLRVVVYAAGIMPQVATGINFVEERAMMETNVIGAMRWFGLAADVFEGERAGTLAAISSVAGERGRPGNGAYMASKAALSTYLDALRFRLAPRGVRVVTLKPGYVATPMTAGLKLPRPLVTSANAAAAQMARAIEHGSAVAYVPRYWGPILWVVRHLPRRVLARLPG